jgi:hypothetical protein
MHIFLMAWEEKERSWGNRPDGWSLHVSREEYERFLELHWARVPNPRPEEYSFPVPDLALREVELPEDHPLTLRLAAGKSLRIDQYADERRELEKLTGIKWPGG